MRKLTAVFICAAVMVCAGVFAKDVAVRVFVDGRETKLDPPAMIKDGKAYVGIRGIADALGASTKWDNESKTATITVGNKRTRVKQSEGITVNGSLFLPLRVTSEAVGCTVEWDGAAKAIRIAKEAPAKAGGG